MQIHSNEKNPCLAHWHFNKKINPKGFLSIYSNMQHRGGCNPVTPAQRSAMCLQNLNERSHIIYKITPTNVTPTTSWEYIFPQTLGFSLHEKPLWTGTYKRPYCLSLMILTSLTGNASFLLPGKPPHLPGGNLHMEIKCSLFIELLVFTHMNSNYQQVWGTNNEVTQDKKIQHWKIISCRNVRF